jgi:hypothetical protein
MRIGRHSVVAAATLALAAPAAAPAASLQPIKPCYVSVDDDVRERVTLAGTGYSPNAVLEFLIDGTVIGGVVSDETGAFGPTTVKAPPRTATVRAFRVTVAERGNPANSVTLRSLVAALVLRVKPANAPAGATVKWVGRGFTSGDGIYAHYVLDGTHRRTRRLGPATGPCGFFKTRAKQFPFRPRVGSWRVRVDNQRRYTKEPAGVFYTLKFDVFRAR